MRNVYRAWHEELERTVMVETVQAQGGLEPLVRDFLRRGEMASGLHHPHVVEILERGVFAGRAYQVVEYMEGGSLGRFLGGQPLPPAEAARVVEGLARAVQAAHQVGILHLDLNPSTVLVHRFAVLPGTDPAADRTGSPGAGGATTPPYTAKIDYRKVVDPQVWDETSRPEFMWRGSPGYQAPEQFLGRDVGLAADIYGLGAILYELLTGRPPYGKEKSGAEMLRLVLRGELTPPRKIQPAVPQELEFVCLKCLSQSPGGRYPSAASLSRALGNLFLT
jgi:serine/threonine protein kinase